MGCQASEIKSRLSGRPTIAVSNLLYADPL
jgi:hypothetical protein